MSVWSVVTGAVTAAAAITALIAGYVQFVLRRTAFPAAQLDVDVASVAQDPTSLDQICEIDVTICNRGQRMLIVEDVFCRVLWRSSADGVTWDGVEPNFPHRLMDFSGRGASVASSSLNPTSVPNSTPSSPVSPSSSSVADPVGVPTWVAVLTRF